MTLACGLLWLVGLGMLLAISVGYAATLPLMRRRSPDPADHPAAHGMPCTEVNFPSRDGLTLSGWWIPARGEPRGSVILCSGQNGSMDKDVPQAFPLMMAGFNVLMFDFRAHGRSEGETVTLGALETADLFGALDYAAGRGIERVGVVGFSMGAGVALMVAAQDARIGALVVDGAYPRVIGLLDGYMRIKGVAGPLARLLAWWVLLSASLRARYSLYRANPADLAERITVPVLFIHGNLDVFVSNDEIEALAARIPGPHEVWRVYDAGHREAFGLHREEYNRRLIEWFERHLVE